MTLVEANVFRRSLVHVGRRYFSRRRHINVETSCNRFRVPPTRCEVRRKMGHYSRRGKCSVGRGWTINCIVWPSSDVVSVTSGIGLEILDVSLIASGIGLGIPNMLLIASGIGLGVSDVSPNCVGNRALFSMFLCYALRVLRLFNFILY